VLSSTEGCGQRLLREAIDLNLIYASGHSAELDEKDFSATEEAVTEGATCDT